ALVELAKPAMTRITGPLLACALALASAPANAQAGATPAPPEGRDASMASEPRGGSAQVPTADDICPRARAVSGGERPACRVLCPGDMAGKPLRCEGYQSGERPGFSLSAILRVRPAASQHTPERNRPSGSNLRLDPLQPPRRSPCRYVQARLLEPRFRSEANR